MTADGFKTAIAGRLKSCRKMMGISLDEAARLTGVSKAMLGQIERLESAPTVATLWKIASGLKVSFSSFFAGEEITGTPGSSFPDDPDMKVKVIFPFDPATRMETFEVTLLNHRHQRSTAHQPGVVEHVIVLDGMLEVFCDGGWRKRGKGDALAFNADQPHEYRAETNEARFLNIIIYA